MKPLQAKAYGSTPHLPGSRLGTGDHHCEAGQARICTERARDKFDRVFVSEKLDGSCCAVANVDGEILALNRSGYLAQSSKFEQHQLFAWWVRERSAVFQGILQPGERIVGEWLAQAHSTRYALRHEPFVAFAFFRGQKRQPLLELWALCERIGLPVAHPLFERPATIEEALAALRTHGHHGALDAVEGAVWVVERKGVFDFAAKFVRHEKSDGIYLPEISGSEAIWNWRPGGEQPSGEAASD